MKLSRRVAAALSALILPALLSGCWDSHQTNHLAIVDALAIDYRHHQYVVTAEVYNISAFPSPGQPIGSTGGSNKTASITLTGRGRTLGAAMADLSATSSHFVFWAATKVVILGSSSLKAGLEPILGTFLHYPDFRPTANLWVTQGRASEIVSTSQSGMETTVGDDIRNQERHLYHDLSRGWAPRAYTVLRWETEHGRSLVLPLIEKASNSSSPTTGAQFSMPESAVLTPEGQIQGWLPGPDTPDFLIALNRAHQSFSSLACPSGGETTIYWTHLHSHTHIDVHGRHVTGVRIAVGGTAKLAGPLCDPLASVNQAANRAATSEMLATVQWAQEHHSDIFGWGQQIFRHNPGLWDTLSKTWPTTFSRMPVSVNSQITVVQGGQGRV